ncbi:hypothetical protein [Streptomyces sp. WMMB 322]|uniref:hypothetical protein n=1 Tax=Streptomyces sp. WMMB 322 TaxID=1286821 RepID=UPI000823A28F|nr:hypothetical protein [Streptomyces sp. WMMB 322]SCK14477.1 hypothetical protein H180DRAFT_00926 [Streptomyces sp. WMMB 322]
MSSRTRRRGGGGSRDRGEAGAAGPVAGIVRLARSAVFAAVCVVTTAWGHALMSREVLPWWAAGIAFSGGVLGGWWLTGRERGAPAVIGTTVLTQALLHLLFTFAPWATGPTGTAHATANAHHGSHSHAMTVSHAGMAMHHGEHMGGAGATESAGSSFVSVVTHGGSTGMLLAHLLAAVMCGLWLWRGEAAVHRIGRTLGAVLFAPLRRVFRALSHARSGGAAPSWRTVVHGGEHWQPVLTALKHVVVRRGPPHGGGAASRLSPGALHAVGQ